MHEGYASQNLNRPAADPYLWPLDPNVVFLNHGSFGSCPRAVLTKQTEYRELMEREPIVFLVRELEERLDVSRLALSRFLGCATDDLVFVNNATTGVNTVLNSIRFKPGDEILVTNHEYNACRNALNVAAERTGAVPKVVEIPFPIQSVGEVVDRVLARLTSRTKLALIDHVTSQTGMVLPVSELSSQLRRRGVEMLIDGAHGPGMLPIQLNDIGAAYYTGNCHKWICAPKGAAFLYVRKELQSTIRPLTISHGASSPRQDRSRFQIEFGWTGTTDPTAALCVRDALEFMDRAVPGGWEEVMKRNRSLALAARSILCETLEINPPCPDEMIGTMVSLPLPELETSATPKPPLYLDPWQDRLWKNSRIEVPVIPWPASPHRLLRISAQLYNHLDHYQRLGKALATLLTSPVPAAS